MIRNYRLHESVTINLIFLRLTKLTLLWLLQAEISSNKLPCHGCSHIILVSSQMELQRVQHLQARTSSRTIVMAIVSAMLSSSSGIKKLYGDSLTSLGKHFYWNPSPNDFEHDSKHHPGLKRNIKTSALVSHRGWAFRQPFVFSAQKTFAHFLAFTSLVNSRLLVDCLFSGWTVEDRKRRKNY